MTDMKKFLALVPVLIHFSAAGFWLFRRTFKQRKIFNPIVDADAAGLAKGFGLADSALLKCAKHQLRYL